MSISSYSSDHSAASQPRLQDFTQSIPSRQSGMVHGSARCSRDVRNRASLGKPPVRLSSPSEPPGWAQCTRQRHSAMPCIKECRRVGLTSHQNGTGPTA
eukprot:scaffold3517_cov110-Isochrysis_galbana.AAC.3